MTTALTGAGAATGGAAATGTGTAAAAGTGTAAGTGAAAAAGPRRTRGTGPAETDRDLERSITRNLTRARVGHAWIVPSRSSRNTASRANSTAVPRPCLIRGARIAAPRARTSSTPSVACPPVPPAPPRRARGDADDSTLAECARLMIPAALATFFGLLYVELGDAVFLGLASAAAVLLALFLREQTDREFATPVRAPVRAPVPVPVPGAIPVPGAALAPAAAAAPGPVAGAVAAPVADFAPAPAPHARAPGARAAEGGA
jgi:hypothetical protein